MIHYKDVHKVPSLIKHSEVFQNNQEVELLVLIL